MNRPRGYICLRITSTDTYVQRAHSISTYERYIAKIRRRRHTRLLYEEYARLRETSRAPCIAAVVLHTVARAARAAACTNTYYFIVRRTRVRPISSLTFSRSQSLGHHRFYSSFFFFYYYFDLPRSFLHTRKSPSVRDFVASACAVPAAVQRAAQLCAVVYPVLGSIDKTSIRLKSKLARDDKYYVTS